jgi:kumamolisin
MKHQAAPGPRRYAKQVDASLVVKGLRPVSHVEPVPMPKKAGSRPPEGRSRCPRAAGAAAIFASVLAASCGTTAAAPPKAAPLHPVGATSNTTALSDPGGSSWWFTFLSTCKNLGPSRAPQASTIIDLSAHANVGLVEQWAHSHGLQLQWYVGKLVAVVSARPAQLGAALRVRIDDFRSPSGQLFFAARTQPTVPRLLSRDIEAIATVTDYKDYSDGYVQPGGLSPQALLQAYDATPLRAQGINGAGETVVAFEIDGYTQSDLNKFASRYNLPPFNAQGGFSVNGGEAGPAQGESNMDLETVREIAPAAKIVYYNLAQGATSASTFPELLVAAFTKANRLYPGAVWTLSLGGCEKTVGFASLDAENAAAIAAEANGTSIFAASGDTGGLECVNMQDWGTAPQQSDMGVWNPAVLPAVTGVGGTTLSVTTSGAYASESAWYYPVLGLGTSGGTSTYIAQPSWQVGQGLPTPSSKVPREVPDVSAVGDPLTGNTIYNEGEPATGGGTSLATPIWAGFMALIDEYLEHHGKAPVGFLNPDLYYLADHAQAYPPFHFVTTGGNSVWRNGQGYNQSTGLGTPDVYNLARDFVSYEAAK